MLGLIIYETLDVIFHTVKVGYSVTKYAYSWYASSPQDDNTQQKDTNENNDKIIQATEKEKGEKGEREREGQLTSEQVNLLTQEIQQLKKRIQELESNHLKQE